MGYWTWTDARREPRVKSSGEYRKSDVIQYGGFAKIVLPDNKEYCEECYDGYGMFGDVDAYAVIVDLNKKFLKTIFARLEYAHPNGFWGKSLKQLAWRYAEDDMSGVYAEINRLQSDPNSGYMHVTKDDWKRTLGIAICCDDADNAALPYPLKITKCRAKLCYWDLVPSRTTQ